MTQIVENSVDSTPPPQPAPVLVLTASAARRINALNAKDGTDKMFRLTVEGGGCSGFQYIFALDDQKAEDDLTFPRDGAVLVTDPTSVDLIAGSEVDFVEDLMGAYFQVRNPNATASCGCGTSFSVG